MQLALEQIIVQPGQQLLLKEISWSQFETILHEMGDSRAARLSYSNGWLEIMVPLSEHERNKFLIGELITLLLAGMQIDFESLGSTTFKNEQMTQAVEPDSCFYIQSYRAVIGKNKIDLTIDPPPDLVIEIDITFRTHFHNYEALGVPELWRYTRNGLEINLLQSGNYLQSAASPNFPNIPIIDLVNQTIEQAQQEGRSQAIRTLKAWVQQNLGTMPS